MKAFTTHTGTVAVLYQENIDTDQIIPKEHLKSIQKTGFGTGLFSGWRYLKDGSNHPDFPLNKPEAQGTTVLLTGNNFGCGSSREHAVWAIQQYGFAAVIAPAKKSGNGDIPAFADIFRNNSGKNGLLTIELSQDQILQLKSKIEENPKALMTIDLHKQNLVLENLSFNFDIDDSVKNKLLHGLDDIGLTLQQEQNIKNYEKTRVDFLNR